MIQLLYETKKELKNNIDSGYVDIEYDIILTDEGDKKLEEYEKVKQKEIEFENMQLKLQF